MHTKFDRELRELQLRQPVPNAAVVTEEDLAALPATAQRYLRFMGVVGKPRVWSLRVGFEGRFKMARDSGRKRCEAIQYNSREELARIFYLTLRVGPVTLLGRDTYRHGHGRMLGKAFDLVTFVDGSGPEFDISELVTFLNDAVLMAPAMLLGPGVTWTAVDDSSFDVALTDEGRTVTGRVLLDERGAPVDFSTNDRYGDDPVHKGKYIKTRWTTPVAGWTEIAGRHVPTRVKAMWHPEGEESFAYIEVQVLPETVAFNVEPGPVPPRR